MPKAKNKYIHTQDTKLPIYGGRFVVVLSNSDKLICKELGTERDDGELHAYSVLVPRGILRGYCVVLNLDLKGCAITAGTIAHEANHIVNLVFGYSRVIPDTENDEAQSYLLGYVVDTIMEFIAKNNLSDKVKIHKHESTL